MSNAFEPGPSTTVNSNVAANTPANAATTSTSKALKYKPFRQRGLFVKDLGPMMFGFGDASPSAPESVLLMEQLLIDHITSVCLSAQRSAQTPDKLKVEDLKFSLRHDPKKLARVDELLFMTEVIARARGRDDLEQYADEPIAGTKGKGAAGGAEEGEATSGAMQAPSTKMTTTTTTSVQVPTISVGGANGRGREEAGGEEGGPDGPDRPKKKKKKSKKDKGKKEAKDVE